MILLTMVLALAAQAQTRLSEEQVDQVIAYAQTAGGTGARAATRHHPSAPRIFDAVRAAQAKGAAFSRAQVTPEMAATTLTVRAYPDPPGSDDARPLTPRRVLIRAARARFTRTPLARYRSAGRLRVALASLAKA